MPSWETMVAIFAGAALLYGVIRIYGNAREAVGYGDAIIDADEIVGESAERGAVVRAAGRPDHAAILRRVHARQARRNAETRALRKENGGTG